MPTELYRKHRPKLLKQLRGQPEATKILKGLLKKGLPHVVMAVGPSGTGKTTALRILAKKIGCTEDNIAEYNTADFNGIDTIRDIRKNSPYAAWGGGKRVFLLDECHKLTPDAQSALLKMTEEPQEHVYFFFATTNPQKIIPTLRGRCSIIPFKAIGMADLRKLIEETAQKEKAKLGDGVAAEIAAMAEGSAREALQCLGLVISLPPDEQLECVTSSAMQTEAFELIKVLMPFRGRPQWSDVAKVLKALETEDAEGLRQLVLKVCSTHMLKGGPMAMVAFNVYQCFKESLYANKRPGLVAMAFDVCHPPGK